MKREITHIIIEFNKADFEYDVHSLVRAFYQGVAVSILNEKEPKEPWQLRINLHYYFDRVEVEIYEEEQLRARETVEVDYYKERKETKNVIKRLLYQMLCKQTGKELPWGDLTGIRPTKIAMGLLESGMSNLETANYMRNTYLSGNEKTALAIRIANKERQILENIHCKDGYSLYIGIPFCPSICAYCSFSSNPIHQWRNRVDDYLAALCKEIQFVADIYKDKILDTIYIGGGTPTTLDEDQIKRLLEVIAESFSLDHVSEYTIEAGRPDSITREKLEVIKSHSTPQIPTNLRISINPQTMNQETLDIIGRAHTVSQTEEAFSLAREVGFDNINMDLIIGLPGEDKAKIEYTLQQVEKLAPESVTVHSLAVKRAARLNIFKSEFQEMTMDNSQEIMDMAYLYATKMGMAPYYLYRQKNIAGNLENIGYATEGYEGIYNILMMEEKQTVMALGAGAVTKLVHSPDDIQRIENVKDIENYIVRIDEMIERKRQGIEKYGIEKQGIKKHEIKKYKIKKY